MALRVFKCKSCGHKLRYGSARCGYCQFDTPLANRRTFVAALAVLGGLGLFILVI